MHSKQTPRYTNIKVSLFLALMAIIVSLGCARGIRATNLSLTDQSAESLSREVETLLSNKRFNEANRIVGDALAFSTS